MTDGVLRRLLVALLLALVGIGFSLLFAGLMKVDQATIMLPAMLAAFVVASMATPVRRSR